MESHSASKALPLDYIIQHAQTLSKEDIRDDIVGDIYRTSASICKESVQYTNTDKLYRSEKLDKIFTSPIWGFPIMLGILSIIFYLTIAGANVPSDMIAEFFG